MLTYDVSENSLSDNFQDCNRDVDEMLTLKADCSIGWTKDDRWKEMEILGKILTEEGFET